MRFIRIVRAVIPVALIMIIAWLGMLGVLYVVNSLITYFPSGGSPLEKLVTSLVRLILSATIAFLWLLLWFFLIVKYREKVLK